MGKKKKIEFTLSKVKIEFVCSQCGKQEAEVSVHDFSASDQECELCGSHGHISVDIKCPKCKSYSEIELQSW